MTIENSPRCWVAGLRAFSIKRLPECMAKGIPRTGRAPANILEAVTDRRLLIWHSFFGITGLNNDTNVLFRSIVFDDVMYAKEIPVEFLLNCYSYSRGYCLTGDIYPDWTLHIKMIRHPIELKKKNYFQKCKNRWEKISKAVSVCFKHGSMF